jgi:hypothetical protein
MIAKVVGAVMCLAMLLCVGLGIASIDWYAYGPAQAPDRADEVYSSLAQLETLRIGEVDALQQPVSLEWSQYVPVNVSAQCAAGRFQEDRKPGDKFKNKKRAATSSEKQRASVFIRILRKSSLGGGTACVSSCGSGARIDKKHVLRWEGKLRIPHVPGDYLAQVVLVCIKHSQPDVKEIDEVLIGTFPLKVVPGTKTGS